jgi:trimeric autotransporter adhesin
MSESATASESLSPSQTAEPSQTASGSYSLSQTASESYSPSQTAAESYSPSQTASESYSPSQTASESYSPSQTASESYSPSQTASESRSPSQTASGSLSASLTASGSVSISQTASASISPSPTQTASGTSTPLPIDYSGTLMVVEPLDGTNLYLNQTFQLRWNVSDTNKVDCSGAEKSQPVSTSLRTGRSYLRAFLAAPPANATSTSSFSFVNATVLNENLNASLVCAAGSSYYAGDFFIPVTYTQGPAQLAIAVVSGKGSALVLDMAAFAVMNGTVNITTVPPVIDNTNALAVLEPVYGATFTLNQTFRLRWNVTDNNKLDCTSAEPNGSISITERYGRSYLRAYIVASATPSFKNLMPLGDGSPLLACSDTSTVNSVNLTMPNNFTLGIPAKVLIVVVSGKGSATTMPAAAFAFNNGTISFPAPPANEAGGNDIYDGKEGLAFTFPTERIEAKVNSIITIKWRVTNSSRLDCTSLASEFPSTSTRIGRSLIQAFLSPLNNMTNALATPLAGRFPAACTPVLQSPTPYAGEANFTVPQYYKWGNATLGIAVTVGNGSSNTPWDNAARALMPGAVSIVPELPSAIDFVIPEPDAGSVLFAAATGTTIRWRTTALDCFAGSTATSKVRVELIVPRAPSVAHLFQPYNITLAQEMNACIGVSQNIYNNGSLTLTMPADLPFSNNASVVISVVNGWAKGLLKVSTPTYITLRGNRGVSVVYPGPNSAMRIPRRLTIYNSTAATAALLSPSTYSPPPRMLGWNTGYLACRFNPTAQTDLSVLDFVQVRAFKENDYYSSTLTPLALSNMSVWTYSDVLNGTVRPVPACTTNTTAASPFGTGGVDAFDLPLNAFDTITRYVLVVSVISGPNAGLASAPVPFTVVKPSIQLRPTSAADPLTTSAPAGSTYTLTWSASGLSSDEMCYITLKNSTVTYSLATAKCMDNKATFLLSTVNSAGVRVNVGVKTGYTFQVTLVTADTNGFPVPSTLVTGTSQPFEIKPGADIKANSVKIRRPSSATSMDATITVASLTSISLGARVLLSWELFLVPDRSPVVAKLCHNTQALFVDPAFTNGTMTKCGVVFDGYAPTNVTAMNLPVFLNVTLPGAPAEYRVDVEVTLLASGTVLKASSPNFNITAPAIEDAKLKVTDPTASPAFTVALSQPFNVTWATTALARSEQLMVELYRVVPGASNSQSLVENYTISVVRVDNLGGSCQPAYSCKGTITVMGLDMIDGVIPADKMKDTFQVCVRLFSATTTLFDCSAPFTIFRQVQPMVFASLVVPAGTASLVSSSIGGTASSSPIFKAGSTVSVQYTSQAVAKLVFTLMSTDKKAIPAAYSQPVEMVATSSGVYPWPIPKDFVSADLQQQVASTLFWVSVSSKESPAVPIVVDTATFIVVPENGSLIIKTPSAGSSYDLGKTLQISWQALAVTARLNISLWAASPSVTDPAVMTLRQIATLARLLPASQMMWTWPGSWINETALQFAGGATSGKFAIRLVTQDGFVSTATGVFTVQKPSVRFDSVTSTPQNGTVKLGDTMTVWWKAVNLPFGTSGTLMLVPSDMAASTMMPSGDRVKVISRAVPLATASSSSSASGAGSSYKFTITGNFEKNTRYLIYLVANGLGDVTGWGPMPGFSVTLPNDGFALLLNPPSAADGGAFIVGSQDSPLTVTWVTTLGGVEQTDANAVVVTLENKLMPGWSRTVFDKELATVKNRSFALPTDLDLSPGVSSSYFVRALNTFSKGNNTSPLFTAAVPKAVITVKSPAAGTVLASPASGLAFDVSFDVSKLPGLTDNASPLVSITIVNSFVKGVVFESGDYPASVTTTNKFTFSVPMEYVPPKGAENAFFAVVRSTQYPSIAGSSGPFTIRSGQEPPSFAFTSSDGSSVITAVLRETQNPTLFWRASNFPDFTLINITLRNAASPSLERRVATDQFVDLGFTGLMDAPLAALNEVRDASKRGLFFFSVTSDSLPSFSANSSFFAITPENTVVLKFLAPSTSFSCSAAEEIAASWISLGISSGATLTLELVNDVAGTTTLLSDGLPAADGQGRYSGKLSANTPASPFYYLRLKASSIAVFAQSPLISVMAAAQTSVTVFQPSSTMTALTGQPLDIVWRSFAADAYTLTITLVNDLIDSQGFIAKVAEGISPALAAATSTDGNSRMSWMVPGTLRTSSDVRRAYRLKFNLYSSASGALYGQSWWSDPFTIASRDAFVSAVSPTAGSLMTLGGTLQVSWVSRNLKNGKYRITLLNEELNNQWLVTEGSDVTNLDPVSGTSSGSFSWTIPTNLPITPASSSLWYAVITPLDLPSAAVKAGPFAMRSLASPYTVLSPVKDAVIANGSLVRVVFTSQASSSDDAGKVTITLCNKMLSTEVVLASPVTTTSTQVLIPASVPMGAAVRSFYFIRISPTVAGTGFSSSESDMFTIAPQATGFIQVSAPSVGAIFSRADRIGVAWSASSSLSGSTVRVEISNSRTLAKATLGFASIGQTDPNSPTMLVGSASFPIPASLPVPTGNSQDAGRFVIRVVSNSDESIFDTSARFSISAPPQVIRIVNTSCDSPRPSPMAGERVDVFWAALGLSADAKVALFLRNMTASSVDSTSYSSTAVNDDTSLIPAGTTSIGTSDNCAMWNYSAPTTIESGGAPWVCGMYQVLLDDSQATLEVNGTMRAFSQWSIAVRSADDPFISGQSRVFTVRPRQPQLSIMITKPMGGSYIMPVNTTSTTPPVPMLSGYEYIVGDVLPVEWVFMGGTGSGRVELFCISPYGGEIKLDVINPSVVLSSLKPANTFRLTYAKFAVGGETRYDRCFVQVKLNTAQVSLAAFARSAFFPIRLPSVGLNLRVPDPLRSSVSASSLMINSAFTWGSVNFTQTLQKNPDYAGPITYLSGQGLNISWSFSTVETPMSGYSELRVTLRKLNPFEGTSEEVYTFWPTPEVLASIAAGNDPGPLPTSLNAETNAIPGTLPLGLYSVEVSARATAINKGLVDRSEPFFIKPRFPSFSIVEPKARAIVEAGGLLRIAFASKGVAATNRVMITITTAETGKKNTTLMTNSTESTGIYQWPIPPDFVAIQTRFTVRVSLIENSTARADSGVFFIKPKNRYITVDQPAADPMTNALPLWKAEDQVSVSFTFVGFDSDVTAASIELWQDRFFIAGGGDKLLAVLAPAVPLMTNMGARPALTNKTGSFSFPVPSDIDSSSLVYVLVRPASENATIAQISGRSKPFPIRSAPIAGLQDFLMRLCGGLWDNPSMPLPSWMVATPALKAYCAKSCSDCISATFDGLWMPAVTTALDFNFTWIGGQRELRMFKNLLGAFRATDSNICWPRTLVDKTSLGAGSSAYAYTFSIPWYEQYAFNASAGTAVNTTARLVASDVFKPLTSCTGMQPLSKSSFSIRGLDPSSLVSGQALEDVVRRIKADVLSRLQSNGVAAQDGDVTVSVDTNGGMGSGSGIPPPPASTSSSSASSSTASGTSISSMIARRLQQASGGTSSPTSSGNSTSNSTNIATSGSVVVSTAGDSDAQAASVLIAGSNPMATPSQQSNNSSSTNSTSGPLFAVPGLSIGGGQTVTTQQQQAAGTSGGTLPAFIVAATDGSSSKAPCADNSDDQKTHAFAAGGFMELLAKVAKDRDLGTPAFTPPPPTPTPKPVPGPEDRNIVAIAAGGGAALFVLIVVGIFAGRAYYKNQSRRKWQGGLLSSEPDKRLAGSSGGGSKSPGSSGASRLKLNPARRNGVLSSTAPTGVGNRSGSNNSRNGGGGGGVGLPGTPMGDDESATAPMITNPLKAQAKRQVRPTSGGSAMSNV